MREPPKNAKKAKRYQRTDRRTDQPMDLLFQKLVTKSKLLKFPGVKTASYLIGSEVILH